MKRYEDVVAILVALFMMCCPAATTAFSPSSSSDAAGTHVRSNRPHSENAGLSPESCATPSSASAKFGIDDNIRTDESGIPRRSVFVRARETAFIASFLYTFAPGVLLELAQASSFAPGGTLVDYEVGVQVGNPEASPSRKIDNSNVLFSQDYYYKFGTAANWDAVPPKMPFAPGQQRYDTLKKYKDRVDRGIQLMVGLREKIQNADQWKEILPANAPEYSIRPIGLLTNGLLASENTGTTNELLLARWYINEMYLDILDINRSIASSDKEGALKSHGRLIRAVNSYLGLINRVITDKVGSKFDLVS